MDITIRTKAGETYRTIKEIADATSHDLTIRQLLVLLDVAYSDELSQQALADRHDMMKPTVSKIIGNLAGNTGDVKHTGMGMLSVHMDPADLRSRLITLSRDGEKVFTRAFKEGGRR